MQSVVPDPVRNGTPAELALRREQPQQVPPHDRILQQQLPDQRRPGDRQHIGVLRELQDLHHRSHRFLGEGPGREASEVL